MVKIGLKLNLATIKEMIPLKVFFINSIVIFLILLEISNKEAEI